MKRNRQNDPATLGRLFKAVEFAFNINKDPSSDESNGHIFSTWNFHHYDNQKTLTEFLYAHGIRA